MENNKAQVLAGQIALLLRENENETDDYLRSALEKINLRLDNIESGFDFRNPKTEAQNPKLIHPSRQKFAVLEAIADDISEYYETEKPCPYEPTGKPCDHCSMCSSLGF